MENEIIFRPLKEEDYETIVQWQTKWWKINLPKTMLPDDGKSGFMIEKNNKPVACAFFYVTNSKIALIGWVMSDPEYREEDRQLLIESLITNIEHTSKKMGYVHMYTISGHKNLSKTYRKLGWVDSNESVVHLMKNL